MTDDYLIKPFSARELLALVETHVKMARMRRDAQIALRESEERLRLANLATNDAICDWEIDTDTLVWNQGIETLFGWSHAACSPRMVAWWIERIYPMTGIACPIIFSRCPTIRQKPPGRRSTNQKGRWHTCLHS